MKKALALIIVLVFICSSLTVSANTNNEYDCSEWAVDSITMAHVLGLVDADNTYLYKEPISREHFCELIYNLILTTDYFENWYNEQTNGGTQPIAPFAKKPFDDTKNDAVYTLYNHNIVYGKTADEFAPNDNLTREEAATIIVRMINIVQPLPATELYYSYDDIEEMSEWSLQSIQEISNLGLMNGVGDNKFAPIDTYTVEQAVTTVLRVYNAFKDVCVLKFVDKDDNIILTEDDIVSCNAKYGEISLDGIEEWHLEVVFTSDAREKFKRATKHISKCAENYITITYENSIISMPRVMAEIDSESVLITGSFTEESAKTLEDVINLAK